MRNRLSYAEEKQNAWYYVAESLELMKVYPMPADMLDAYRAEIDRLATRYGFRRKLQALGYDLPPAERFNREKYLERGKGTTERGF